MSTITEPVNIGNPDELTMLQLAKESGLTGARVGRPPLPKMTIKSTATDISKAKSPLLAAESARSVGLKKTLEYFRRKISSSPRA
jgi:dTDP-glucose 4,6-dehydratase